VIGGDNNLCCQIGNRKIKKISPARFGSWASGGIDFGASAKHTGFCTIPAQ